MSLASYFRALLVIFVLLVGAELASDLMTASWLPTPLREFVENQYKDATPTPQLAMLAVLVLGSLALMLISVVGLWFFWRPARFLYTLFLLSLASAVAASGTIVETALTSVFAFMNTIIAGVILGLIYFSPLNERFEPPNLDTPPT